MVGVAAAENSSGRTATATVSLQAATPQVHLHRQHSLPALPLRPPSSPLSSRTAREISVAIDSSGHSLSLSLAALPRPAVDDYFIVDFRSSACDNALFSWTRVLTPLCTDATAKRHGALTPVFPGRCPYPSAILRFSTAVLHLPCSCALTEA